MSVVKRGARVGVAALALGLSLAGPQAAGVASADSPDSDSPSAASSSDSASQGSRRGGQGSRAAQPADSGSRTPHRGPAVNSAAPVDEAVDQAPVDIPGPKAGGAISDAAPAPEPTRNSSPEAAQQQAPAPAAAATASVPRSNDFPAAAAVTGGLTEQLAEQPSGAAATTTTPRPAAALATATTPTPTVSIPPALAKPAAIIGQTVTGFFDTAANWLTGLPNGPLSSFLEGALLMVRRTFFQIFPELNAANTTGQTAPNPAYFTDEQLRSYLLDLAEQQYGSLFGTTVPVYGYGPYPYPEYLKMDSTATPPSSTTNTQVNGVDEADYVENDGKYVYVAHNGQLTIVRASDTSVVSQSSLSGNVLGEYLSGNRLTVVSQSGSGWYGPVVKMAYGPWQPWKPQTTVTVYDVTDRSAPTVVKQTTFDGSYQSSRAVDGTVYLVLQRSVQLPAPNYTETPINYLTPVEGAPVDGVAREAKIRYDPSAPIAYRTYETWDAYVARVGGDIVNLSLPHAYTVNADGTTVDLGLAADAADIVRPQTPDQQSLITVVSVDGKHSGGFIDSVGTMVSGWASTVYMNKGALYVATSQDDTRIDRFNVAGPLLGWQGTGVVPGTLINQFAMDERDGYLRVATHTNSGDNGIYVLDTAGATLDQVGQLTGLAPGEQLYAVRYVGNSAYLVTFVRTDPLFAIDLADPTSPTLTGELVVPGFSNYLQPVGDGLLLGIGQERETASWNNHLQATLFNVADGAPTQLDREYLDSGYQWSWSDAQFDHHALLYSAQDGLLVVPVAASGYDQQTGYRYSQYLKVLRVGPAGLEVVGEIHPRDSVQRTVRIGDVLYAVGDTTVTAYRLSDLSEIGTTAAAPSPV